jgi:hypothetical protein
MVQHPGGSEAYESITGREETETKCVQAGHSNSKAIADRVYAVAQRKPSTNVVVYECRLRLSNGLFVHSWAIRGRLRAPEPSRSSPLSKSYA